MAGVVRPVDVDAWCQASGVTLAALRRAIPNDCFAPVPWRSPEAEDAIRGRTLDASTAAAAAAAAVEGAEPLAQNGFKVALTRGIVEEGLLAMV